MCDSSVFILRQVDNATGYLVDGGQYEITLPDNVYALAGYHSDQAAAFTKAFNDAATDWFATDAGKLWASATQEKLGTDFVGYPENITSTTQDKQAEALKAWQKSDKFVAFKADIARRLDAVSKALDAAKDLATIDKATFDAANLTKTHLASLAKLADTAATTTDWATFTDTYKNLTNKDTWEYGLIVTPSVEYRDKQAGSDWAAMNKAGADAIKATRTITVTVDEGNGVFTVFGIAGSYTDSATRGDVTCKQFTASAQQKVAPKGYVADTKLYKDVIRSTSLTDDKYSYPNGYTTISVKKDTATKGQDGTTKTGKSGNTTKTGKTGNTGTTNTGTKKPGKLPSTGN